MFAGNFAPAGWALCQGQIMPIAENDTLFNLIGTTYGGDGQETFGLPNLAGRIPIHPGTNFNSLGEMGGTESVTLTTQQLPVHSHLMVGSNNDGSSFAPGNAVLGSLPTATQATAYGTDPPTGQLDPSSIMPVGGNQPHENMMRYLCINFIISLYGVYPTQS